MTTGTTHCVFFTLDEDDPKMFQRMKAIARTHRGRYASALEPLQEKLGDPYIPRLPPRFVFLTREDMEAFVREWQEAEVLRSP